MLVIVAAHHPVAPGFARHPEGGVIKFFIRIGLLPRDQRLAGFLFQLLPRGQLHVFGGVHAKTVNAVITHPLTEPLDEIIPWRGAGDRRRVGIGLMAIEVRQAGGGSGFGFEIRQEGQGHGLVVKARVVVIPDVGTDPLLAPPPVPGGLIAEVDVVVKAVPALPGGGFPVDPAFAQRLLQLCALQIERAKLEFLHIREGGVAGVVHHHVEQNADPAAVGFVHQGAQIRFVAHVGVQPGPVLGVVTVVGIVREVAFGSAANPAVDLLQRGADPERVDAELL